MLSGSCRVGLTFTMFLLAVPVAGAVEKEAVDRAVSRAVEYLKSIQSEEGSWAYLPKHHTQNVGSTALVALALLECDVPPTDPRIVHAAGYIRTHAFDNTYTYSIAFSILFLDRLGDEADVPLIESLAVRLLRGQLSNNAWSYECPAPTAEDTRRLQDALKVRPELRAAKTVPRAEWKADRWRQRDPDDLPKEIKDQLKGLPQARPDAEAADTTRGDHSNTQLANLALWVAGRYGLPVENALARVEAHYRRVQNHDGGWSYLIQFPAPGRPRAMGIHYNSTGTMTCAGLLGLATAHGAANDLAVREGKKPATQPDKDANVKAGLAALGSVVGQPQGKAGLARIPVLGPGPFGKGYYLLWSIERVAVAYGLKTLGGKDWYAWGTEILLKNQAADGSWSGEYAKGGCDTAFSLLFLRHSNLTPDLTSLLRGSFKDPDQRELRAGGFGGDTIGKKIGLEPAFGTGDDTTSSGAPRSTDPAIARLATQLVDATGNNQTQILEELRDGKGAVYTEALAVAIARLEGASRTRARQALADRLWRMTSETLRTKLADANPEVRRAAAIAAAMKEDDSHIARLIELLTDEEVSVQRAAYAALKSLTGQDFGPAVDASRDEQARAVSAWKTWWARQKPR